MKHQSLFLLVLLLSSFSIAARDFTYTYEGQTITYTVIDENEKTIKTRDNGDLIAGNFVEGDLLLPEKVLDGEIEYSLTEIGIGSFKRCENLTSVKIPSSVNEIGDHAFSGCTGLKSVDIPNSVTVIGYGSFEKCLSLTSIEIPNSVTQIGWSSFSYCRSLTSVDIPNSVTKIGQQAFSYCTSLTSVDIPNSVTEIGTYAFSYCTNLASVHISNSVTQIGLCAFMFCDSLLSINVDNENPNYCSLDGTLFDKGKTIVIQYPTGKEGSYLIPSSVTEIGELAFSYCAGLTSIEIPHSVTRIGKLAFLACSGLGSVEIPNSVIEIGPRAFEYCRGLTSIEIPNSVTEIGKEAFWGCSGLTTVTLGLLVEKIGAYAFHYCNNLTNINCLAVIPPELESDVFLNIKVSSILLRVPVQSIALYKAAEQWCDFDIVPLDEDSFSISVSLPADAKDGRYRNLSIELINGSNSQKYKYLISDKTEYVFGNLPPSPDYYVAVKNSRNEVLGEINGLQLVDKDIAVAFESLLQPRNISLKVSTPEGEDVTDVVTVRWYNESDEMLHQGSSLKGVIENSVASFDIVMPKQMCNSYIQPLRQTVRVSDRDTIEYTLGKIDRVLLSGRVCDKDGHSIRNATVVVSHNINGSLANSINVSCDNEGRFEIETINVPVKVSISADGYVAQTMELSSASMGIGEILLVKNTGLTIYPAFTLQKSLAVGDAQEETESFDYDADIVYRIEDMIGNEMTDCIYQNGSIILPERIVLGDKVNLIAYSKKNGFREVSQVVELNSMNTYVNLVIVEYGGVNVTVSDTSTTSALCLLYDGEGNQVRKSSIRNGSLIFTGLPDGQYSLVAMCYSPLLGSISNLSSLQETQLEHGSDYKMKTVDVVSGSISDVEISDIPDLDETKLYYTNGQESYFMPAKSQVTTGNYIALKAKYTIKDEYAGSVESATLIVDLPANCEFVNNSVITGVDFLGYELSGNRLSIPINKMSDVARFCIIPLVGGECMPTAFVKLVIDNKEILQPIGSAHFKAKYLSLTAPEKTSRTSIAIKGTAIPGSEIMIYDNETLVGSTHTKPDGEWNTTISLYKPYSKSFHNLYGEVVTQEGKRLLTKSKTVQYGQGNVDLSSVTMVYSNNKIVFDHLNGNTSSNYYSYAPGRADFSFIADFSENDPNLISNVVIKVLASDGSVRSLPAEYNPATGNWVAQSKYANSNKIPVNATAEFDAFQSSEYDETMEDDYLNEMNNAIQIIKDKYDDGVMKIEESQNDELIISVIPKDESEKEFFKFKKLDYEVVKKEISDYSGHFKNDTIDVSYKFSAQDGVMSLYYIDHLHREGVNITYSALQNPKSPKQSRIVPLLMNIVYGVGISYFERNLNQGLVNFWKSSYISDLELWNRNIAGLENLIAAKCKDGSNRIKNESVLSNIRESANDLLIEKDNFFKDYKYAVSELESFFDLQLGLNITLNCTLSCISAGIGKWIKGFVPIGTDDVLYNLSKRTLVEAGVDLASTIARNSVGKIIYDHLSQGYSFPNAVSRWYGVESHKLTNKTVDLIKRVKNAYGNCDVKDVGPEDDDQGDNNGNDDFPASPVTPSIDPSGYVYEAVPSNRVSGVIATIYFKQQSEDIYGDITESAVLWDAVPFGQENPLTTDAEGMYAWDVPAGMWQVRFEKEGYEPAQTEWLPVPPPQLDVNIPMIQVKQPEVKSVHAFSDGVTIEFDKFMLPSTLSLENIAVTQNGIVAEGDIEGVDMEMDVNGNAFCSKINFKPASSFEEGEVTVFVSKKVKSYADINMAEDFEQSFTVEPRISNIQVADYLAVNSGSTVRVTATVLPASAAVGKIVEVESLNPLIATVSDSKVEVDSDGNVEFDLSGFVLGKTEIKLTVVGYDAEAMINISVLPPSSDQQVATPYASVESGEIENGTEIYLYCDSENAVIYYTVDGTCPCDVDRICYDGIPITAMKDFTLKVMAEVEGVGESEIVEYHYTVKSSGIETVKADSDLTVYPLPLGEYLNISNGDHIIESVSILNMNGTTLIHTNKHGRTICLNVGSLTPGIYLLDVKSQGKSFVKKVIKR